MIRRLLCFSLLLVALAAPAAAKVAIIRNDIRGGVDADNGIEDAIASQAQVDVVTGILHQFALQQGIPDDSLYVVVPASRVTPYQYRFGRFCRAVGSADSFSVDAVIHPNFWKVPNTAQYGGTYRPHAMTRADSLPYVPQLLLLNTGIWASYNAISVVSYVDASTCSLGVKNVATDGIISDGESPSGTHEGERSQYQIGHPEIWFNTDYSGFAVRNTADPAGGLSVLIGTAGNANFFHGESWGVITNADSCGRSATGDSMAVWTRRNSHASGARELVCAIAFSPNYGLQSGDEAEKIRDFIRLSVPNIMFGLAHLDSITGRKVFGSGTIDVALAVTHWMSQSERRYPGGYFRADSTNVYDSLDSLAALGEKITFAVNTDSLIYSPYDESSDLRELLAVPRAKFAPMILTGALFDTTKVSGGTAGTRVANYSRPIDPFGRYRRRSLSYGPWPPTTGAADSSSSTLFRGALDLTRTYFGADRTCAVLWPAGEDWSPINYEKSDSVLIAARLAGVKGIVFNPTDRTISSAFPGSNPRGWYNEARTVHGVKLIPRIQGNTIATKWLLDIADADSSFPASTATAQSFPLFISQRAWMATLGPRYDLSFSTPRDPTDNGTVDGLGYWGVGGRGRILAVSAQELSGPTTPEYAMQPGGPYRSGWVGIKHFVHAARVVNRLAGRSLIRFVWLDEL